MITNAIITSAYYILGFFVTLFPLSSGFPAEVSAAFTYLGSYVGMLDPLVPVTTLATCVAILITIELLIFSFRILSWIFAKIPVIGK